MKISNGILAVIIAALCIGGMAFGKPVSYPKAPPYINPAGDSMPLSASYIFHKEAPVTRQDLQWIKDCGFNMFRASMNETKLINTLDSMDGMGLKMSFYVWEALGNRTEEMVNKYKDNPNIGMYFIMDEPRASHFPHIHYLDSLFRNADSTRMNFVNLNPIAKPEALESPDYDTYVEEFVRIVNPPLISYDFYPVSKRKGKIVVADAFYTTIETIARVARESERPFWGYILTTQHWAYPKPKREYLRFQIFTNLAYGAQGFSYYTYCLPDFDREKGEYSNSPIDANGQRTDVWYMLRDVNQEVHNLEKVFLGAEVLDVAHTGAVIPTATKRLRLAPSPFRWIASDGEGVLVSHLKNGNDEYLVMVNRSVTKKQKVRFSLSQPVTRITGDGKEKEESGTSVTLSPGGYAIYRL